MFSVGRRVKGRFTTGGVAHACPGIVLRCRYVQRLHVNRNYGLVMYVGRVNERHRPIVVSVGVTPTG